jgi:hypothetical protein
MRSNDRPSSHKKAQKIICAFFVLFCGLALDSQSSGVARLPMGFDPHGARAGGESIGQSENYLDEVSVRYESHAFCRHVVDVVVSVDEIHYHRRRKFTLGQLKIPDEHDYSRVLIAAKVERVRGVKDLERISQKEHGV